MEMPEDSWIVTISVKMSAKGITSRDEAVKSAIHRLEQQIRARGEVPYSVEVRRMRPKEEEDDPLFGQNWYTS